MLKNKFAPKISNYKSNSLYIFISCLILATYPTSHLTAQELVLVPGAPKEAVQTAESTPQDENFKLTFDKIDSSRFYGKAVLQILNKTTAKSSVVEVPVGGSTKIGQLSVKVDKCWQAPLEQKPDSRILLEISETKIDGITKRIFFGWMISSSPSISSLEHPIYDVTALSCKNK